MVAVRGWAEVGPRMEGARMEGSAAVTVTAAVCAGLRGIRRG